MSDNGTLSASKIFELLVSGNSDDMNMGMALLVTSADAIDKRCLRNLIRDRLQSGLMEDGKWAKDAATVTTVKAYLLTALSRITEEELEETKSVGLVEKQEAERRLLHETNGGADYERVRARTAAVERYTTALADAEARVRWLFETAVRQARIGFNLAASMDLVVFLLGVLLLAGSAVAALGATTLLTLWAAAGVGSVGIIGIIYALLIGRARRQIGDSVNDLVRLQVIFLAYLRQLHQVDKAYTLRLLEDREFTAGEVADFQNMIQTTMSNALEQIPVQQSMPMHELEDEPYVVPSAAGPGTPRPGPSTGAVEAAS